MRRWRWMSASQVYSPESPIRRNGFSEIGGCDMSKMISDLKRPHVAAGVHQFGALHAHRVPRASVYSAALLRRGDQPN